MQNATLKIKQDRVEYINGLLTGKFPCETKDAEVIVEITAKFPDGCEVDLKLVSGGRAGEDDADLPYLDPVLFSPGGTELCCLDPGHENILGEYRFDVDEEQYLLVVEPAEQE
jgi:hypothetical protein